MRVAKKEIDSRSAEPWNEVGNQTDGGKEYYFAKKLRNEGFRRYNLNSRALSYRYARAAAKSKSALAAKRTAAAAAATKTARSITPPSVSVVAVDGPRDSIGHSTNQGENRAERGRTVATVPSWREKLAAVRRRRAVLECSMRDEAQRLVESRAKKEVRYAAVCWIS